MDMTSLGLLAVRLALALVALAHGLHKLFGFFAGPGVGSGGLDQTAAYLGGIGLEPAFPLALLAGLTQLSTGALIGLGWLTRWAAFVLSLYMLMGLVFEHWRWGLFLNWLSTPGRGNGVEYSVVILGALVLLMFAGGGDLSVDGRRSRHMESRAAGLDRIRRKF
jgi:putative oxidoreductase